MGQTVAKMSPSSLEATRWSVPWGCDGVGRPRRPWCARVGVLQVTQGGIHEPGEHRRTGSRQVHLSTARSRQRGSCCLSQEAAPHPASSVPGNAPALHGGPGGLCERTLLGREIAKLGHTVKLI